MGRLRLRDLQQCARLPGTESSSNDKTVRIVTMSNAFTSAERVDTDKAWPRVVERGFSGDEQDYDVVTWRSRATAQSDTHPSPRSAYLASRPMWSLSPCSSTTTST